MTAEDHAAFRRAHVDLLYVTGQLPGIEHLFAGRAERFEPIPLDDRDAVGARVGQAGKTLLDSKALKRAVKFARRSKSEEMPSAPPLSSSDWLRSFATLAYHQGTLDGKQPDFNSELLLRVGVRGTLVKSESGKKKVKPKTAKEALLSLTEHLVRHKTPKIATALQRMSEHDRARFVAVVGERAVHALESCHVDPIPQLTNGDAARIAAEYTTHQPVEDFMEPADPRNWPKCNSFFRSMRVIGASKDLDQPDISDPNHKGYATRLEEIVDFGYMTVRTNLDVVYYVNPDRKSPGATGMTFRWAAGGDGLIDVDHGHLTVEATAAGPTRVRSSKVLRFSEQAGLKGDAAMTGGYWACQLGWLDSMKQMNRCTPT